MQTQDVSNSNLLFAGCPSSLDEFFSGQISKNIGYVPLVGSIIGISRICFAIYQNQIGKPNWGQDRLVAELTRGSIEALSLGPLLLIYDLFFAKISTSDEAPLTTSVSVPSFTLLRSGSFTDHADRLVALYATKTPNQQLTGLYNAYRSSGNHLMSGQTLFQGADFFTRHGTMHASFVAMFIPIFLSLYRDAGHPEAAGLTAEDIQAIQAVAFLHDYGRVQTSNDLCLDRHELEMIGQAKAYQYLKYGMGLSEEKAQRFSQLITTKDAPLAGKSLIQQLLQNCDSLAVLRADDWLFDPNFLDMFRWIQNSLPEGSERVNAREQLFLVVDAAKRMLVELSDSPYNMNCLSERNRGQVIAGAFSLVTKRTYEQSPQCYSLMTQVLRRHNDLQSRL